MFQKRRGVILCYQLNFEEDFQIISSKANKITRKATI